MPSPRVSILIPNFDNGRAASRDGDRDFIDDLLRSLVATLEDDPTPLEIVVLDDGSRDDSLATCRAWAARTWRGGAPVCRLIEREHRGVLSAVANDLVRAARGEICVRLDGDVVCLTPRWAEAVCRVFDEGPPELGIVGPKQLGLDGRIHSAGSWILHPRGHHHVAQGLPRDAVGASFAVDHVMGCFYAHRRAVWMAVGGYDETILRGQTVDFTLAARCRGWQVWSVPTIEFIHAHAARRPRDNAADTVDGIRGALDRFRAKWGFDRVAPDLDAVRARWRGTGLLWNAAVFGPAAPYPPPARAALDPARSEWARYADDAAFRAAVDWWATIGAELVAEGGGPLVVMPGRGGLLAHRIARTGVPTIALEADPRRRELAGRMLSRAATADLRLEPWPDDRRLPFADGAIGALLLLEALDAHSNPIALLREARRVLRADGTVACIGPERVGAHDAGPTHPYRRHELEAQLRHAGFRTSAASAPAGWLHVRGRAVGAAPASALDGAAHASS